MLLAGGPCAEGKDLQSSCHHAPEAQAEVARKEEGVGMSRFVVFLGSIDVGRSLDVPLSM